MDERCLSTGGACGDPCPKCGDCRHRHGSEPCCNPKCNGEWGTNCYHCHHSSFIERETMPKTTEKTEAKRNPQDPEFAAMSSCIRALEKLDAPARQRVLGYIVDRYSADIVTTVVESGGKRTVTIAAPYTEPADDC